MKAANKTKHINETVDQLRSSAHSAVDKTANITVKAAEILNRKSEKLKSMEEQYMEQCRKYIHTRPFASIGLAIGAGFLLNRIVNGR